MESCDIVCLFFNFFKNLFLFFIFFILGASGNCVVVLLPSSVCSSDMESGGCGLCVSGCGQLYLTSNGTGSLNYDFCV